jgi:hypothetical protein
MNSKYTAPRSVPADPSFVVETSKGPIALLQNEHDLLNRLLAGTASVAEGQSFYQTLVSREAPFPMEWEVLILRATIAALPDRDDLVSRLALIEQTIAPGLEVDDLTLRLAFEKTWIRFAQSDLTSAPGQPSRDILISAIDNACMLLASPVFDRQPVSRKVALIVALHNTLMSVPSAGLPVVADLGLRRFRDMLRDPELSEAQACSVFDALHSLYFAGISDVRDLRRFDAIVPAFEAWLEQRIGRHSPPPITPVAQRPLTIAYLLHTAHFDRGNAVSPLVCSIAEMHAAVPNRRILLYAVQHIAPDFAAEMAAKRNVTVRAFQQSYDYNKIEEVAEALKSDGVDIVVTEQNRAIAAALFVRRVAPRQMWFDTGFPFWNLKALDWTMSPAFDAATSVEPRTSLITLRQTADTLKKPIDSAAVARLRESFPSGVFVFGVFVRLIKLNRAFLDFLERLLASDSRFHLVIAGPGDPESVESFVHRPEMAGRVTFVSGNVDLNLYGPAIDVMCDTFPFIGGNACREVASHGTPVLSKLGTPWDNLLKADRNPDLLARTEDEFIALATRLASDNDFRQKQRQVALTKAAEYSDPTRMIEDIEAAIAESMAYH